MERFLEELSRKLAHLYNVQGTCEYVKIPIDGNTDLNILLELAKAQRVIGPDGGREQFIEALKKARFKMDTSSDIQSSYKREIRRVKI